MEINLFFFYWNYEKIYHFLLSTKLQFYLFIYLFFFGGGGGAVCGVPMQPRNVRLLGGAFDSYQHTVINSCYRRWMI